MADAKAPVAIRIVRPYGSPEEYVRGDLETLTKTSITLTGAQPRPKGVILRFEVTLASGRPVMRGEGRVLGYTDEAGLSLRFTRLDPKSKALVDWAAGIKDARAKGQPEPAPPELPSGKLPGERPSDPDLSKHAQAPKPVPPPSVPPPVRSAPPPSAPPARSAPSRPPPPARPPPSAPPPPSEPSPSVRARLDEAPTATSLEDLPTQATTRDMPVLPDLAGLTNLMQRSAEAKVSEAKPRAAAAAGAIPAVAPEKKSELLDRLRSRARSMPAEQVQAILKRRTV